MAAQCLSCCGPPECPFIPDGDGSRNEYRLPHLIDGDTWESKQARGH